MILAEKKVRPLVVLTRTTFCRASAIRGSLKGHDIIVHSAPFHAVDRKYPPIVLKRGVGRMVWWELGGNGLDRDGQIVIRGKRG